MYFKFSHIENGSYNYQKIYSLNYNKLIQTKNLQYFIITKMRMLKCFFFVECKLFISFRFFLNYSKIFKYDLPSNKMFHKTVFLPLMSESNN